MAQFDSLIIFPLLWSLVFVLFLYYSMSIEILIPTFFGTKKFREKKLDSSAFFAFFKSNSEVKSNYSYSNVSFY
jgi:hypothetical protein